MNMTPQRDDDTKSIVERYADIASITERSDSNKNEPNHKIIVTFKDGTVEKLSGYRMEALKSGETGVIVDVQEHEIRM